MRTCWRLLRCVLVAYLVVLLVLMFFEESFIFQPSKYPKGNWNPLGLDFEDAHFKSDDGTELHGWYLNHEAHRAVVLFAHGNAGNLSHRAETIRFLHEQLELTILVFDYRGYGRSAGSPHEEGVLQDARAARSWLAERAQVSPSEIVLMGRSLGGAVAVDLAAQGGARGLILESTFTRLPDVAAVHFPWLPVRLLLRTQLHSLNKIAAYQGPLLMSHSDTDEIVPFELGQRLFDASPSSRKRFIQLSGQGHNDLQPNDYYEALDEFLGQLSAPTAF